MPLIALLFLAVPIIELVVIVYAARVIGTPQALVMLIVVSIVGAWLVKVEGLGIFRRFMATASRGQIPHREIIDGVLVLVAGAFMLTPGFVTDIVGLLLLLPPSRAVARGFVIKRATAGVFSRLPGNGVWETSGWEAEPGSRPTGRPPEPPPGIDP